MGRTLKVLDTHKKKTTKTQFQTQRRKKNTLERVEISDIKKNKICNVLKFHTQRRITLKRTFKILGHKER